MIKSEYKAEPRYQRGNKMPDFTTLSKTIKEGAAVVPRRKLTGRTAAAGELFGFLTSRIRLRSGTVMLCTEKGLICGSFSPGHEEDLTGFTASEEMFKDMQLDILEGSSESEGYRLISDIPEKDRALVSRLASSLKGLLDIFDANHSREHKLLRSLDYADNAICIYDKEACFLYGNKTYLNNMQMGDGREFTGMNILDITKRTGIRIQATKNGSDNLKMFDVLKNGRKVRDWEVQIESQTSPSKAQFISNNMYPVRDRSGKVDGLVEIASSHQVNLSKTKTIMGLTAEHTFDSIVGSSAAIKDVIQQAKEYASSSYNLLIVGESGCGKELFAQAIHNYSRRRDEAFVALNCASFPENLIESELFGYVGGAFTGASKNGQMGKFELADGGTLFLDEIGELPFHFQSKLLRVLETGKITRIGSSSQTPVNVRVVAATNRDLEKMIDEGLFRKDLYYRLQVLNIEIPPLRDRKEDLRLLTESFFRQAAEATDEEQKSLDAEAIQCLEAYDWPGNVRELRNVIQRVTLLSKTDIVTKDVLEAAIYSKGYSLSHRDHDAADIAVPQTEGAAGIGDPRTFIGPGSRETTAGTLHENGISGSKQQRSDEKQTETAPSTQLPPDASPDEIIESHMKEIDAAYARMLNDVLAITNGNKTQAAELLGISRRTIYRMIDKYC